MKKIIIRKKLNLSKEVISKLNDSQMGDVNGGCPPDGPTIYNGCNTAELMCMTAPGDCVPFTTEIP